MNTLPTFYHKFIGSAHKIVRELETVSTWDRPVWAAAAVKALGTIACKSDLAQLCLPKLLHLLNDPRDLVSGSAREIHISP